MKATYPRWWWLLVVGSLTLACAIPHGWRKMVSREVVTPTAAPRATHPAAATASPAATRGPRPTTAPRTPTAVVPPARPTLPPTPAVTAAPPEAAAAELQHLAVLAPLPPGPVALQRLYMADERHGWALVPVPRAADAADHEPLLTDEGVRILTTADGGFTWYEVTPFLPGHPETRFLPLVAVFWGADHAWAVSYEEGLTWFDYPERFVVWRTEDRGRTWAWQVVSAQHTYTPPLWMGVASDAQHVWLFGSAAAGMHHADIGLFATADGGRTWQQVVETNHPCLGLSPVDMTFAPHSLYGVVTLDQTPADGGGLCVTTDGGTTWEQQWFRWDDVSSCGLYEPNLWAAGEGAILIECLEPEVPFLLLLHQGVGEAIRPFGDYTDLDPIDARLSFPTAQEGYTAFLVREGDLLNTHLLFSDDGGRHWTPRAVLVGDAIFTWLPGGEGWAIVRDQGALLHTTDGGRNWEPLPPPQVQP